MQNYPPGPKDNPPFYRVFLAIYHSLHAKKGTKEPVQFNERRGKAESNTSIGIYHFPNGKAGGGGGYQIPWASVFMSIYHSRMGKLARGTKLHGRRILSVPYPHRPLFRGKMIITRSYPHPFDLVRPPPATLPPYGQTIIVHTRPRPSTLAFGERRIAIPTSPI